MIARAVLIAAVAAATLGIACGDDDDSGEEEVPAAGEEGQTLEVTAVDFAFEPGEFGARRGELTRVVVENAGDADHTFTIDEVGIDQTIGPGEQVTLSFDAPDEDAEYYCRFHSDMRGTVVIDPTEEPPTEAGQATEEASDGATPDETDDDDDGDDDDDNSGSGSGSSGSNGYTY